MITFIIQNTRGDTREHIKNHDDAATRHNTLTNELGYRSALHVGGGKFQLINTVPRHIDDFEIMYFRPLSGG